MKKHNIFIYAIVLIAFILVPLSQSWARSKAKVGKSRFVVTGVKTSTVLSGGDIVTYVSSVSGRYVRDNRTHSRTGYKSGYSGYINPRGTHSFQKRGYKNRSSYGKRYSSGSFKRSTLGGKPSYGGRSRGYVRLR